VIQIDSPTRFGQFIQIDSCMVKISYSIHPPQLPVSGGPLIQHSQLVISAGTANVS